MMGIKERDFQMHPQVRLDALVPAENFYRKLENQLDLSFVRDLVRDFYAPFGRPSVDPVVFFKLQLIMFFEDIRSERQLMETVAMRLDHRWYIAYDLFEDMPDHSSLCKIRDRYGVMIFHRFFERIVELCIDAGLVWGRELFFDGSIIDANADYANQLPRFYWQRVQEHLAARELELDPLQAPDHRSQIPNLVRKYDGKQLVVKPNSYKKQADYWVCPTDPDATRIGMGKKTLGYRLHYGVDGGKARIILSCLVTPTIIQDHTPLLDLVWHNRFRWRLKLRLAVADTRYGVAENIAGLEQQGIHAYMPLFRDPVAKGTQKRTRVLAKSLFTYDSQKDHYICPQGKILPHRSTSGGYHLYRAMGKDCRACPLKPQCTQNKNGRTLSHSIYKAYEDRVTQYQETVAYQRAMRKRRVWIEPKFGEVKQWHRGRRFRLRGILKVNMEALIRAAGQNIKQLLKGKRPSHRPLPPPIAVTIRPSFQLFGCFG